MADRARRVWRAAAITGIGWILAVDYAATTIDPTPRVVPMVRDHSPDPVYPQTTDT